MLRNKVFYTTIILSCIVVLCFLGCQKVGIESPTAVENQDQGTANSEVILAKQQELDPIPEAAYIGHIFAPFVSVVDVQTMTEIDQISVPASDALNIAIASNGKFAYITHRNPASVSKADLSTNSVIQTVPLDPGTDPFDVALTPNGKKVFVTQFFGNSVTAIDAGTLNVLAVIPLTDNTDFVNGIAMGPGGQNVFVSSQGSGRVHVIDTKKLELVAAIEPGLGGVNELALTQNGKFIFGTAFGAQAVVVIDAKDFVVIKNIALTHSAFSIDIPSNGQEAYATGSNVLSVIDTKTLSVITTVQGVAGRRIGVNTNGRLAITTGGGKATLIDLVNRVILQSVVLGGGTWGVDFLNGPQRNK